MKVSINSSYPLRIEAGAEEFGGMFAAMNSEEQVQVFREMILHMRPHQTQWDYISIELDRPENEDVRDFFRNFVSSFDDAALAKAKGAA